MGCLIELKFCEILKVSAFYLEKQKCFIPKKIFLSNCQYQNKKALFTDPIFSEGFGLGYALCHYHNLVWACASW